MPTTERLYLVYTHEEERMPPAPPEDADRETANRLNELIQALLPTRPLVVHAIERCVVALVVDETRQRIIERLGRLSPEDLATVDAVTASLERKGHDGV